MVIRLRDSTGTLRTVGRVKVKDNNGVTRTVSRIRVMDDTGTLRTVFNSLSVSSSVSDISITGTSNVLISGTVAITVSGGTAPYTYAWTSNVDFGTGSISFTNASGTATQVRASGLFSGTDLLGTVTCTVTDDASVVQVITIPFMFLYFDPENPTP